MTMYAGAGEFSLEMLRRETSRTDSATSRIGEISIES
jgi:hypothetical protein